MTTVFRERTVPAGAGLTKKTTPENAGAGYAIVMGVVVPVGGGPGGVTKKTSGDSTPLTETTAVNSGVTERTTI